MSRSLLQKRRATAIVLPPEHVAQRGSSIRPPYTAAMPYNTSKKRKRGQESGDPPAPSATNGVDTSKPTAIFEPKGGRSWTLSVAIPGSIILNAQSHDLRTILAGQIARALAVFSVDEVIIFDDGQGGASRRRHPAAAPHQQQHQSSRGQPNDHDTTNDHISSYTGHTDPNHFLTHLLTYLETPPYLRKHLLPIHPNLRTAGTLPSLDMPHHYRADEWCVYKEGVTLPMEEEEEEEQGDHGGGVVVGGGDQQRGSSQNPTKKKRKTTTENKPASTHPPSTIVEVGLHQKVIVPVSIPPNTRVTLKLTSSTGQDDGEGTYISAQAVSPSAPRTEAGYYWGYNIRRCASLSAVFTECPWEGGYDVSFGTSERGRPVDDALSSLTGIPFKHMVVVFGGVAGLEKACEKDEELRRLGVGRDGSGVETLFDHWINLLPKGQGSRTVRTEEAVWIGLMALKGVVDANQGG
ncbi:MAG: hypothetical protein M1816_004035 [Peltula sp. TS41687]|nr:MAG: hypothetical protein M1816_004035 [Peltula sp. TS41687]